MDALPLAEFRRLDHNAEACGVPVSRLMAKAARGLADLAIGLRGDGPIVFVCGKGNNGGDGYAAAAMLHDEGHDVRVLAVTPAKDLQGPGRAYRDALPDDRIVAWSKRRAVAGASLYVDCILGSGITGEPRGTAAEAIRWLRGKRVLACDVPSGMGAKNHVQALATATFHAPKHGMEESCGDVHVIPIGIPKAAHDVGPGDLHQAYRIPGRDSHKGDNGRVLVLGGGPFRGAPYYAGMAALRAGSDMVHLAAPRNAAATIETWGPDLLVHAIGDGDILAPAHVEEVVALLDLADAVVLGPGLGTNEATRDAATQILDVLAKRRMPAVIDADGLDAITQHHLRSGAPWVLTPHAKEFQDLSGWKPTDANVRRYAQDIVVLRKGAVDLIAGPHGARRCHAGHPTMTVGGTGDLLAGVTGALLARGASPFEAACGAAYLVGKAGEWAAELRSWGATAMDICEAIPAVLRSELE